VRRFCVVLTFCVESSMRDSKEPLRTNEDAAFDSEVQMRLNLLF